MKKIDNKKIEELKNEITLLEGLICTLTCTVTDQQMEIDDLKFKIEKINSSLV